MRPFTDVLLRDIYQDGPYYAAEGVHRVLRRLKRRGVALGIVSNRGARPGRLMTLQLEANGLMEFFDHQGGHLVGRGGCQET